MYYNGRYNCTLYPHENERLIHFADLFWIIVVLSQLDGKANNAIFKNFEMHRKPYYIIILMINFQYTHVLSSSPNELLVQLNT